MARLAVRVTPKASRDQIVGWVGDELRIKVTAPPEDGKANAAVERLIAVTCGVAPSCVHVIRGHTARSKLLEIDGLSAHELGAHLPAPSA